MRRGGRRKSGHTGPVELHSSGIWAFPSSVLGPQPFPVPALPHTKAVPGIRGVLLGGGALLDGSARVLLRLLQGQHHSGLFHPAGVQGKKGSGSQGGSLAPRPRQPPQMISRHRRRSPSGAGGHFAENNLPHLLVSFTDLILVECFLL